MHATARTAPAEALSADARRARDAISRVIDATGIAIHLTTVGLVIVAQHPEVTPGLYLYREVPSDDDLLLPRWDKLYTARLDIPRVGVADVCAAVRSMPLLAQATVVYYSSGIGLVPCAG